MAAGAKLGGRRRSPVLEALADLYAASTLGTTGRGRDFGAPFREVLAAAGCLSGDGYANALLDLDEAERSGLLVLERRRGIEQPQRVRVAVANEAALFDRVHRPSPTSEREAWSALLEDAATWTVPAHRSAPWKAFCRERADLLRRGRGWSPFRRRQRHRAHLQLEIVARLLTWRHPALLRTVSAQLTGSSKFLERCRATIESLLAAASGGEVRVFADLGIADNPRSVTFHGPVRMGRDYGGIEGAVSLSEHEIARSEWIDCTAPRCVTVENATKFHELTRLGSGDLFVLTSYPNRATVEFLRRLPASLPRHHFGDTDPWGFDVLRTLRVALAPAWVAPLHMTFRPTAGAGVLTPRDRKKLARLLSDPVLADMRPELERMAAAGTKGDFEQETILVSGPFPYA